MATQAVLIAQDNTSDTTWRAWVNGIHNALAALGTIVQTADTGQINLTTATKAAGGYEIWRFADSLQSTAPVFIKMSYSGNPQITFAVGTGTNGAGTLTGSINLDANNFTNTTTAYDYYFSSTTSRLTAWMGVNDGNAILLTIERSRSNAGAETGTGIIALYYGSVHSMIGWITCTADQPSSVTNTGNWDINIVWPNRSTLIGSQMTAFCINPIGINYQVQNPPIGVLLYWPSDLGLAGTLPSITLYGTARTYINPSANPNGFGMVGSARAMLLYE